MPDTDPEMMAMLSQADMRVGLDWRPPPCPKPTRLDNWLFGMVRAGSQHPSLVPFFPEMHEGLTRSWMAPFSAGNQPANFSSLTTFNSGVARGYTPSVERSVAMQLCPNATSTEQDKQ